jgi:hypothetical protein
MKVWCFDPQSGGKKIPLNIQETIINQVYSYSIKQSWHPRFKIILRFRNQFCYLDASENEGPQFPIGRLRHFSNDWSLAFYAYSSESYKPCVFNDGKWLGSIEQGIDVCSVYLE